MRLPAEAKANKPMIAGGVWRALLRGEARII